MLNTVGKNLGTAFTDFISFAVENFVSASNQMIHIIALCSKRVQAITKSGIDASYIYCWYVSAFSTLL